MYGAPGGLGAGDAAEGSPGDVTDGATLAGLKPVPSVDGTVAGTLATLDAPPDAAIKIPLPVGIGLAVCVVFTIFAGVSSPVIDFARHATTLF
jgi:hypothetical protein